MLKNRREVPDTLKTLRKKEKEKGGGSRDSFKPFFKEFERKKNEKGFKVFKNTSIDKTKGIPRLIVAFFDFLSPFVW